MTVTSETKAWNALLEPAIIEGIENSPSFEEPSEDNSKNLNQE